MCPRSKEENTLIREQSANHLLETALEEFALRGYHASSMADIAKKAGVSKGLAYHYFESKEALLMELADRRLEEWLELTEGLESIKNPQKRLRFLVGFVTKELVEKTAALRFYNSLYLSEEGTRAIEKATKKYSVKFNRLLQAEKQLFIDLGYKEAEAEATYFRSLLQGISLEYMLDPKSYPLARMKRMLLKKYGEKNAS
jgi:AcrR family transcriptional regulator